MELSNIEMYFLHLMQGSPYELWLFWETCKVRLVGLGRLELPTSPLSGVRSNQLSYRPIV